MSFIPRVALCVALALYFLGLNSISKANPLALHSSINIPEDFELEVKLRMRNMNCVVTPRLNDEVRFYLGKYIFKHPEFTARMLGNAALYFPVFEKMLDEKGMPAELKALAILESWLDPAATSRVGAGGLWQLMPQTARMYGLEVSKNVDERRDIYRSTEAALNLLKNLHDIYGDWGITLAAYNVGPVRVNSAIKKAGVENPQFWTIAPFLPKETQHFVPKFIAFTYLINYYAEHAIYPKFPELDLQFVDVMKIHQRLTLSELASLTGIQVDLLKKLNPGYRNGQIPANTRGYNLVIPKRVMTQIAEYLNLSDTERKKQILNGINTDTREDQETLYVETTYTVEEGDDLNFIAYRFDLNKLRIMLWNHLNSEYLVPGQKLRLYVPLETYKDKFIIENRPMECVGMMSPDDLFQADVRPQTEQTLEDIPGVISCSTEIMYHTVKLGETWMDIALQHPYANLRDIRKLNSTTPLLSGRQIVIPVTDQVERSLVTPVSRR
jgi:membrane-bound lytic murein transglycosylase D